MILQGTDGLSRGLEAEGVLGGKDFLSFIPLHKSALERESDRISSWYGSRLSPRWLAPEDWFLDGHTKDFCVWSPPPAAADVALEQLAKTVHKRPHLTRLVVAEQKLKEVVKCKSKKRLDSD
jgi:hypothetical protein